MFPCRPYYALDHCPSIQWWVHKEERKQFSSKFLRQVYLRAKAICANFRAPALFHDKRNRMISEDECAGSVARQRVFRHYSQKLSAAIILRRHFKTIRLQQTLCKWKINKKWALYRWLHGWCCVLEIRQFSASHLVGATPTLATVY